MRIQPARTLLPRHERREAILRAAATAFARTGFADTSMEDVLLDDPCELELAKEPQSESATYAPDGSGVYTISEIPVLLDGELPELWFTPLTPGKQE